MRRRAFGPQQVLTTLITILVGTAAVLAALWLLILAGLWLTLRLLDPLLERSRDALRRARIQRRHQDWERHRQALAQQRESQLQRVVDLDGQVRWLQPEQMRAFLRRCWSELELAEGSGWGQVRRQWRRTSLRWHPDHGGDPATWLRKQRAYEALKNAREQTGLLRSPRAEPPRISARSRRWRWPGRMS